jgi:hypothetical protein
MELALLVPWHVLPKSELFKSINLIGHLLGQIEFYGRGASGYVLPDHPLKTLRKLSRLSRQRIGEVANKVYGGVRAVQARSGYPDTKKPAWNGALSRLSGLCGLPGQTYFFLSLILSFLG